MKAKINDKTLYCHFGQIEKMLSEEQRKKITEASEKTFGNFWELKIAQFVEILHGDLSIVGIGKETPDEEITVFQKFWLDYFKKSVDDFAKALERRTLQGDVKSKRASENLLKVSFEENLYLFCQKFFNLKSFSEADEITLYEFLLAKTADYNEKLFQQNIIRLDEQALKSKRK